MSLVVLLKGINVGGYRTMRPAALAREMAHIGVTNIGAAGTFVVTRHITRERLQHMLKRKIPFDADIVIVPGNELLRFVQRTPFARHAVRPDTVQFVSLLADRPKRFPPLPCTLPAKGGWLIKILGAHGRFAFGVYRREMKVISALSRLDQLFGVPCANRSWSTIMRVAAVLGEPFEG